MIYRKFFKRPIDIFASIILLVIALPIFLVCSILIKIDSRGPVFFTQDRAGMNGRIFKIIKFRTMTHKERDLHVQVFSDSTELTKVGSVLRRIKFDELPQLINILFGDMSLIGPRPCLPKTVKEFNEDGVVRLNVRGGVTNLAAVNGSIFLTWPERWKYDRYYVENLTFFMDLKIAMKTIPVLIFGEQIFYKKDRNFDFKKS